MKPVKMRNTNTNKYRPINSGKEIQLESFDSPSTEVEVKETTSFQPRPLVISVGKISNLARVVANPE